jgi:SET domain-containing protein
MAVEIYLPEKVYVSSSQIHGFGVFAKCRIGKDEIIEECPVIHISSDIGTHSDVLSRYRFGWPGGNRDPESTVIPAGYGAIYNHSSNNNATWKSSVIRGTFFFYAIRDIEPGEEILTCYGGEKYWEGLNINPIG